MTSWYDKDDPSYCSPFANDLGIHLENYSYYFVSTPKDGVWSDINHILATSAVLNTPIMSYFPSVQSSVSSFSRVLIGRNVPKPDEMDVKIKIMWTSTEFPKKIENFIPNHFVPLIPRTKNELRPVFRNAWESQRGSMIFVTYKLYLLLIDKIFISGQITLKYVLIKFPFCPASEAETISIQNLVVRASLSL